MASYCKRLSSCFFIWTHRATLETWWPGWGYCRSRPLTWLVHGWPPLWMNRYGINKVYDLSWSSYLYCYCNVMKQNMEFTLLNECMLLYIFQIHGNWSDSFYILDINVLRMHHFFCCGDPVRADKLSIFIRLNIINWMWKDNLLGDHD